MTDLNSVLGTAAAGSSGATGINDAGQIVSEGVRNGQLHAFFLQPMRRPPLFDPCGRIVVGGVLELAG